MIRPVLNLLSRVRKARNASVVRSVAGLPVGVANRRGTVLVLVIGALALISVITLIYATIGQSDRRLSITTKMQVNVSTTSNAVADYISLKLSDAVFGTFVQGDADLNGQPRALLVRQASDYPWTDSYRLSVLPAGTAPTSALGDRRYHVDGSYDSRWTFGGVDLRIPSSPYLAATQPVAMTAPTPGTPPKVMDLHDWLHISDLAPDGRFVNLWNLAPVVNGQRVSGFRADSVMQVTGAGLGQPQSPRIVRGQVLSQMNFGMCLFDANGFPTTNLSYTPLTQADPNVPAHWSCFQQWMYRPAAGPMYFPVAVPPDPLGLSPNQAGSQYYPPYQFCDADGDGFFDSRWFELVDATDPNNPLSLLPKDDRYRWFVGARVVDLSALVNVNTATDLGVYQQGAPTTTPATLFGATPADVDLRRLLAMDDAYRLYSQNAANGPLYGYAGLEQPTLVGSPDNYLQYKQVNARLVGDRAYRALRWALQSESESVLPPNTLIPAVPTTPTSWPLWRDERYTFYASKGGPTEGGYGMTGTTQSFSHSAHFTAADLKELLTYWATNNAASTSRFEQTVDGRLDQANGGNPGLAGLGPMRSNRGDALERRGIDNNDPAGGSLPQGDGLADKDAMMRRAFDQRANVTPVNGSRNLRSNIIPPADPQTGLSAKNALDRGVDQRVDAVRALRLATVTTAANQDPSVLFKGYCAALMPYSWVRTTAGAASAWDPASRYATLSFAHNAEVTLRIAGHMTANMIDSYDKNTTGVANGENNTPHVYTLLIDEEKRTQVPTVVGAGGDPAFPWWAEPGFTPPPPQLATYPGRLDLDQNETTLKRLRATTGVPVADPASVATLGAVNIVGVEAQPFVTMVTTMFIYTDAPMAAGGDDETAGGTEPNHPITIEGGRASDTKGQIIAFQLTNPFDVDIDLTKAGTNTSDPVNDNEFSDFYIQFGGDLATGGMLYKLAEYHEPPGGGPGELTAITLHKGESRVFYCLSEDVSALVPKWNAVAPGTTQPDVDNFVWNQLSISPSPAVNYGNSGQLLGDGRAKPIRIRQMNSSGITQSPLANNLFSGSSSESNRHVMLWRVARTTSADPDTGPGSPNKRFNDLLVDHLRDPAAGPTATLDRRLPVGVHDVAGTDVSVDDTGYSIVLWGAIKRRNDPAAGSPPLGCLPAYCLEGKWAASGGLKNVKNDDGVDLNSLKKTYFVNGGPQPIVNADDHFKQMITRCGTIAGTSPPNLATVIVPDLTRLPGNWATIAGNAMPPNSDPSPQQFDKLYPIVHLNNNRYEGQINPAANSPKISVMRLADLLLPLGVGPEQDPALINPADPGQDWMTLGEALALGLNYSNPPVGTPGWGLYANVGHALTGCLDRGNLALDRGTPFEDVTNTTNPQHPYEGPGSATPGQDQIRWPGIPLSLNVLNVFTVTDPQFCGLTDPQPGLININTAALMPLYTLPMLAPTTEANNTVWATWKQNAKVTAGFTVPEPPSSVGATDGTDLASGILAYREKLLTLDRDSKKIDFTDTNSTNPFDNLVRDGRTQTNKIAAQRETPGFATIGEILAITDHSGPNNTNGTARIALKTDQFDGMAADGQPSGAPGLNTSLFRLATESMQAAQPSHADQVKDDYAEKLLVAESSLGSMTVRSDLFAVWFVIQGYQKSDTEGLGLNDPLRPSVAKRYLMVVDRSNVTRKGEKPRIVFLTEVPM